MATILLATAALSLVAGIVLVRHRQRRKPGVFACRLRPAGHPEQSGRLRAKRYARWVHDVLLVYRGVTLTRCDVLAVADISRPKPASYIRGFGPRPVTLRLRLDDGCVYHLVIRGSELVPAVGPFVVAALDR
jgi:hypothetical protein